MNESSPVTVLHGVGPKRAEQLARLGIFTLHDLLYHFPASYQERGNIVRLTDAPRDICVSVCLTVATRMTTARLRGKMTVSRFTAFDESGTCVVTLFNRQFAAQKYPVGSVHRFWGKVETLHNRYAMTSPDSEAIIPGERLPYFVPRYPLTAGLSHAQMAALTAQALSAFGEGELSDPLPEALRERYRLPSVLSALRTVHFPKKDDDLPSAQRRLLLEELYPYCLRLAQEKRDATVQAGIPMPIDPRADETFLHLLPFAPTGAQRNAMREIAHDMAADAHAGHRSPAMRRMICGDVGSGKTVLAAYAAYIAVKNGYQCAMMAPTEILAQQHRDTLTRLFAPLGIEVALLTGSMTPSAQRKLRERIANGEIPLAVGTHALISEPTRFARLGLVITDEEHRFGVMQRRALAEKGQDSAAPHILVMSATPIPRSLSMLLYGDLQVSHLRELPPGRQRIDTAVIDEGYRARLYRFLRREAGAGHQIYIVCPAIEPPDEQEGDVPADPVCAVLPYTEKLHAEVFPDLTVEALYGSMPPAQKEAVMRRFAAGEIRILVSTTVIEVGVNVPNATVMVVENAERFGLSQLHQLRGRVGRGADKSYCIYVTASKSQTVRERLEVLRTSRDGFEIAEADLRLRGPGDFFPTQDGLVRQHGEFRFLALCDDMTLFEEVMAYAYAQVCPELSLPAVGDPAALQ